MKLFTVKGIPSDQLQEQIIFTPSCGMGSLSLEDAERVLELLSQVGG
jgi:hypothetical protein